MSDKPTTITAARVRSAIKQSGRSQKDIAAQMEISESFLSDLATGRRSVSARVAVRLEVTLGLDPQRLLVDQTLDELRQARAEYEAPFRWELITL